MPLDASSCSKSAAGLSLKASNSGFGPGVQRTFDVRHTSVVILTSEPSLTWSIVVRTENLIRTDKLKESPNVRGQ